jgi:hypothetical protein
MNEAGAAYTRGEERPNAGCLLKRKWMKPTSFMQGSRQQHQTGEGAGSIRIRPLSPAISYILHIVSPRIPPSAPVLALDCDVHSQRTPDSRCIALIDVEARRTRMMSVVIASQRPPPPPLTHAPNGLREMKPFVFTRQGNTQRLSPFPEIP